MSIAQWCVLLAGLLPFVWTSVAKFSGKGFPLRYNRNPREFLEGLEGMRKRAHWAQLNAFEAFPFFAAAVIIAVQAGAEAFYVDLFAIAYIILRILHGIAYLFDRDGLRSAVWFGALGCVIAIFMTTM